MDPKIMEVNHHGKTYSVYGTVHPKEKTELGICKNCNQKRMLHVTEIVASEIHDSHTSLDEPLDSNKAREIISTANKKHRQRFPGFCEECL